MKRILTILIALLSAGCLKALPSTDLTYCRAQWSFSPDAPHISGSVMFQFKSAREPANAIDFDLSDHLHVEKIIYHNTTLPFKHKKNKLVITLPERLEAGIPDSIEIVYHGKTVASGFGSIGFDKNSRQAWTLTQPYGGRDWWPCWQNIYDKIDSMDIYVTCPVKYKVATNGKLEGYIENGPLHTAHYKVRHPVNYYTVGIAVGDYKTAESKAVLPNNDTIGIIDYYPKTMNYPDSSLYNMADFINYLSSYWIPYPFADEKYGQVYFNANLSIEHQTMSFLAYYDILVMAHEMVHQWFGNYVTCSGWRNVWINEGFAMIGELTILEKFCARSVLEWKEYAKLSALTSKKSVFVTDTTKPNDLFDIATTYNKGGMVSLMLRNEIGKEAFQKGCRLILEQYANGFATVDDARKCFETAADTSLTEFFNNWIYGVGHPIYTIKHSKTENGKTTLTIKQTTSDSSVKFYPLHVTVRLLGKDGHKKDVRLHHTQNEQKFIVETDFAVEDVIFDPESDILCKWSKRN